MTSYSRHLGIPLFALLAALLPTNPAGAVDILDSAENIFYRDGDTTRMGIEVEFKGLSAKQSAEKVAAALGGRIETKTETHPTTIKGYDQAGKPIYNEVTLTEYIVKGSRIGDVLLKPETNMIDEASEIDQSKTIVELVTQPIREPQVRELDTALAALKKAGASGTDGETAVSIQVNTEMFEGKREKANPEEIVNLLRAYLRPEHKRQIDAHVKVPDIRKPYIQPYSEGFMKRLLDPNYTPTSRELYDDFMYRQSLELLGEKKAWTMPIEQARKALMAMKNPIAPAVVKQNSIRVSSLLMWMFPEDPYTKFVEKSGWAYARPLVEFRDWNNDFNSHSKARQALGLKAAAKEYGYFDHDRLAQELTGMDAKVLPQLREQVNRARGTDEVVTFRYFLGDPENVVRKDYDYLRPYYGDDAVGFLHPNEFGTKPMLIPGESVVMHRRPYHRLSVMGKYNPGLTNFNIWQSLENKFAEAMFFQYFAPGSMSRTDLLEQVIGKEQEPAKIVATLNQKFPKGWVIKGIWDLGSEKSIITDKTEIVKEIEAYRKSDFDAFRAKVLSDPAKANVAPEYVLTHLKEHPNYKGWKLAQLFKDPTQSIVQERVKIKNEWRVEVEAGKVMGGPTTVDRYSYVYLQNGRANEYVPPPAEDRVKAEAFAQWVLDQIPDEIKGLKVGFKYMPMGMDIAILEDGSATMIESNPGPNSNFLYEEFEETPRELAKLLKSYPARLKAGEVHPGLTPEDQMAWLKLMGEFSQEMGIDSAAQYPGQEFRERDINDQEFKRHVPKPENYLVTRGGKTPCEELFQVFTANPK